MSKFLFRPPYRLGKSNTKAILDRDGRTLTDNYHMLVEELNRNKVIVTLESSIIHRVNTEKSVNDIKLVTVTPEAWQTAQEAVEKFLDSNNVKNIFSCSQVDRIPTVAKQNPNRSLLIIYK